MSRGLVAVISGEITQLFSTLSVWLLWSMWLLVNAGYLPSAVLLTQTLIMIFFSSSGCCLKDQKIILATTYCIREYQTAWHEDKITCFVAMTKSCPSFNIWLGYIWARTVKIFHYFQPQRWDVSLWVHLKRWRSQMTWRLWSRPSTPFLWVIIWELDGL